MLQIKNVLVTDFQQNCRIVTSDATETALVIDPGGDVARVVGELETLGKKCTEIWLTHSHLDHCGGVKELLEQTDAKLYGHQEERVMREKVVEICQMYGLPVGMMQNCPEPDTYLQGGEVLEFAGEKFQVLFTPGHSPGHLSFYHEESKQLIAGDTLFAGSIGRTDLPGGDHNTLLESIRQEIFTLPDDVAVLSGHGPDTTVGKEKQTNPFFQ